MTSCNNLISLILINFEPALIKLNISLYYYYAQCEL